MDEILLKYKEISLAIIEKLKKDEDANDLFDKREELLKRLFNEHSDISLIKIKYNEFNIFKVEEQIKSTLEDEMKKTKAEIDEIQIRKSASRGYASSVRGGNIFSKKI